MSTRSTNDCGDVGDHRFFATTGCNLEQQFKLITEYRHDRAHSIGIRFRRRVHFSGTIHPRHPHTDAPSPARPPTLAPDTHADHSRRRLSVSRMAWHPPAHEGSCDERRQDGVHQARCPGAGSYAWTWDDWRRQGCEGLCECSRRSCRCWSCYAHQC
jgi:hypothetical protein